MDDTEAFNDFIANTSGDLFANDDDDDFLNEEYYNQNKNNLTTETLLRKKNPKLGPFSTTTFWMRTDNNKYDLKNHLWDFMVYNNIREHAFNNYKNKVEMLNSELLLNIISCKKVLLDLPTKSERDANKSLNLLFKSNPNKELDDSYSDEIEDCFNYFVRELLEGYTIKLNPEDLENKLDGLRGNSNYNWSKNLNRRMSPRKRRVEEYVGSHKAVQQLCVQARQYRKNKNELVKNSLFELLKSFNEFRYKILQEVYQESRNSKMNLTRFVKNLDKVSSRFDFFGEYRFHNLRTYLRNKEQLDNFIENYVAFNEFTNDFTEFINTFNPNYSKNDYYSNYSESVVGKDDMDQGDVSMDKDKTTDGSNKDKAEKANQSKDGDIDDIFDFMGGVQSQNYIQSQDFEANKDSGSVADNTTDRSDKDNSTGVKFSDFSNNRDNTTDRSNNTRLESMEVDQESSEMDKKAKDEREVEDLKLLEEARKKAAEILRLKRSQRMQTQ